MNKLRILVTVSVVVAGLPALAYNDASPTVFPDYGAWRGVVQKPQEAQLVSLASATTPVSKEDAARSRERQLKAALDALGIAVE